MYHNPMYASHFFSYSGFAGSKKRRTKIPIGLSRTTDAMKGLNMHSLGQELMVLFASAKGYAPVSGGGASTAASDAAWGTHLTMVAAATRSYVPVPGGASVVSGATSGKQQQQQQRQQLERLESFPHLTAKQQPTKPPRRNSAPSAFSFRGLRQQRQRQRRNSATCAKQQQHPRAKQERRRSAPETTVSTLNPQKSFASGL